MKSKSCVILIVAAVIILIATITTFSLIGASAKEDMINKAWTACEKASENKKETFTGRIFVVQKLNNEPPAMNDWTLLDSISIRSGDAINFTEKLDSAAAILCLRFKDNDKRMCNFQFDKKIDFYGLDMNAVLVSWPDGRLISRTEGSSLPQFECPQLLQCKGECTDQREEVMFPRSWLLEYSH